MALPAESCGVDPFQFRVHPSTKEEKQRCPGDDRPALPKEMSVQADYPYNGTGDLGVDVIGINERMFCHAGELTLLSSFLANLRTTQLMGLEFLPCPIVREVAHERLCDRQQIPRL